MGNTPYVYRNGNKYELGADGRWWIVLYTKGDDDFGFPTTGPGALKGGAAHHGSGRSGNGHSHHHSVRSHTHHVAPGQSIPSRYKPVIDPWNGHEFARQMFQGDGARTFIGANDLVTEMVECYSFLYTAAVFSPEILEYAWTRSMSSFTRWALNQMGAFGPAYGRLFWSGAGSGAVAAVRYGSQLAGYAGQTLEETPLGSLAVWVQQYLPQNGATYEVWTWLSTGLAEGAEDAVVYFEGMGANGPFEGNMWVNTESVILKLRGIDITRMSFPYR